MNSASIILLFQVSTSEPRTVTQHPDNVPSSSNDSRDVTTPSRDVTGGKAVEEDDRKLEEKFGEKMDLFKSVFADSDSEVIVSRGINVSYDHCGCWFSVFVFTKCL